VKCGWGGWSPGTAYQLINLAMAATGDTGAWQELMGIVKAGGMVLPDTGVLQSTSQRQSQHRVTIHPVRQKPWIDAVTVSTPVKSGITKFLTKKLTKFS